MNHEVLGTFAMYYAEPRSPSESDIELIEGAARVAVIAIEGERSQAALTKALDEIKKSEAELRQIIDAIPQAIVVLAPDGSALYANEFVLEYTGLSLEEVQVGDFRARVFHPDDVEKPRDERQKALARGTSFQLEQRARGKDGRYRWFLVHYRPLRDEQGHILRWYATGTAARRRKSGHIGNPG